MCSRSSKVRGGRGGSSVLRSALALGAKAGARGRPRGWAVVLRLALASESIGGRAWATLRPGTAVLRISAFFKLQATEPDPNRMMYVRGNEDDKKVHKAYHKSYFEVVPFKVLRLLRDGAMKLWLQSLIAETG